MTVQPFYRLVAVLWVVWPAASRAQALSEFLDFADRRNVDARLGEVSALQAELEAGQAWGGLLPALTVSGGWVHNQYPAIVTFPTGAATSQTVTIVPADQLDAALKVEVPIIHPGQWFRAASALAAAEAARVRQTGTRDQVHRQVVTAFYLLAGVRSMHDSALKSLAVAEAQLEQQMARQVAGTATELEVVRANAEVERNRQVIADAEAQVANATRSLHTLSGLEPKTLPALPADDLRPELSLTELEGRSDSVPQTRAAEQDALSASRSASSVAAALSPTINAQFTQRFTNATGFQGQSALWNAGLTFNWRLDAVAVQAIRGSRASELSAALNAAKTSLQAKDQIHSDWQRVRAAIKKVTASKAQVESAQRASSLARDRNAAGMATQLDVIQGDRDVFSAEVNDIQARFDLASARASLHLSAGLPIGGTP